MDAFLDLRHDCRWSPDVIINGIKTPGILTPSLKLKRAAVVKDYEAEIEELYG